MAGVSVKIRTLPPSEHKSRTLSIDQHFINVILYRDILFHVTYLFLLLIIRLMCNLFFKNLKNLNVIISSTSLVYAHYKFRPTLEAQQFNQQF
jgi:hypothetical protein